MSIQAAQHLIQLEKYTEAEKVLLSILSSEPSDSYAHILLSLCYSSTKKIDEAIKEADIAIGLSPTEDYFYYVKGLAYYANHKYTKAEHLFKEAFELDPECSIYCAHIAMCLMIRDDSKGALEMAKLAVHLDPEEEYSKNTYIMILNKLGKKEDADELLESLLHHSPNSTDAHANQGWSELQKNNPKKAIVHFKEALRLDPENNYAQAGLIEAIKSRNPIYRIMIMYFLWLGRFSPSGRWAIIIGGYIAFRFADRASYAWPEYALIISPIIYLYLTFAILTWISDPLFNLMLYFHPLGKHALEPEIRKACNVTSIFFLTAVTGVILYFLNFHPITLFTSLLSLMMVPVFYDAFLFQNKTYRKYLLWFNIAMIVCAIATIFLVYSENTLGARFFTTFNYSWIAFILLQGFITKKSYE